jgi:hypothetical protein
MIELLSVALLRKIAPTIHAIHIFQEEYETVKMDRKNKRKDLSEAHNKFYPNGNFEHP